MAWITSDDYALFLVDVSNDNGIVHKKGSRYPILDEKSDAYYIQQKRGTAEVTEFPKDVEGNVFIIE